MFIFIMKEEVTTTVLVVSDKMFETSLESFSYEVQYV